MPTIKNFLIKQARVPKVSLLKTPLSPIGEGVSGILSSIAEALPDLPALPDVPAASAVPGLPQVTEFVKSVESALPAVLPKFSGGGTEATAPAPKKAPPLVFE